MAVIIMQWLSISVDKVADISDQIKEVMQIERPVMQERSRD